MTNQLPPPPKSHTANLTAYTEAMKERDLDPEGWESIPVIDPTKAPYDEWLSGGGSKAVVVVRPDKQWFTYSPQHQVSPNKVFNPGPGEAQYGMSWSDSYSYQHSLGVSATAGVSLKEVFQASVTRSYQYSWGKTTTTGENVQVTVKPDYFGWIERGTLISHVEGWLIWTGVMVHNAPGGGAGIRLKFSGEMGKPVRWRGSMSGPGKDGSMSGVLVTQQKHKSEMGTRILQDGYGFERRGNLVLVPADFPTIALTDLTDPGIQEVLPTP